MRYLLLTLLFGLVAFTGGAQSFTQSAIPDTLFARMQGRSYPADCTVPRSELRLLRVLYCTAEGATREGRIVCHESIAADLLEIFQELYRAHYPIAHIAPIDDYDADDERSMQANNTSCFNYRCAVGSTRLSMHARGRAIDLNPLYNPYVKTRRDGRRIIQPAGAKPYADRTRKFPYKLTADDLAVRLFLQHGFRWGGHWKTLKDYQHFEK